MHALPHNTAPDEPTPIFVRLPSVLRMTALGRSLMYEMIADKKFPCAVRIGERAVAWRLSDIEAWCKGRPAAR